MLVLMYLPVALSRHTTPQPQLLVLLYLLVCLSGYQQVSAAVNVAVTEHGLALPSTMPEEHVLADDSDLMQAREKNASAHFDRNTIRRRCSAAGTRFQASFNLFSCSHDHCH
jgi:hypothetical protein